MTEDTQQILKRLEDDKEYYGEFGRQFLSNSDIGDLLKNPKDFRVPREDNQAFAKGRYFHLDKLVTIMRSNLWFYEHMYLNDNQYEVPAVGEFDGVKWKGKADIVSADYIIDLKTTSDLDKFPRSARMYNYDSQAYIYQSLFGKPMVFFAIDKTSGRMGVYHTSDDFIMSGKQKVERALEVYHRFFGPDATEDVEQFFITETL
jgi:hypothetical protein